MEIVKYILSFCNAAVFYDYKSIGFIDELNQARKCIINSFYETIPVSRILIPISIIDVAILKIHDTYFEKGIEKIHDLRANILYMLSFEKVIREEPNENNSELEYSCKY